jgi:hypothetical protein
MIWGMQLVGRRFAAGFLAVSLSSAMIAQERDWYCPSVPSLPDASAASEKWFVGMIGGVNARMHLIGADDIAKGEFYRQDDWKPTFVGGRMQADGTMLLHEERESNCGIKNECDAPGVLHGTLTNTSLTGTWKTSPDDQPNDIRMTVELEPKCGIDGTRGVFRDPAWPITFGYPTAWHLEPTKGAISLTCPDPEWMAHQGWNLSLTTGILRPSGDLPNEAILSEFTKDDKGRWQYGSSLGGGPKPATVRRRDGMLIIQAEDASRRGYCVIGGYSGLTDEQLVLIIFNSHWVLVEAAPQAADLVDLMVSTAAPQK